MNRGTVIVLKWVNFCGGALFGLGLLVLLWEMPGPVADFIGTFAFVGIGLFAFVTATVLVDNPENKRMRKAARILNAILILIILSWTIHSSLNPDFQLHPVRCFTLLGIVSVAGMNLLMSSTKGVSKEARPVQ
jgi:O-antigen/teichoic acid export membrane protein